MKYLFLYLSAFFILFSCKEKQVQEALYVIDTNVEIKESLKASDIFKKITPIILEEHDNALMGMVSSIEVHSNYIFILDAWTAKALFVYSRDGKYLTQVGAIGLGPGEYLSIRDFCINDDLGEIYLMDNSGLKIHKYKLHTWEYVGSVGLKGDVSYKFIAYSNNKIYASLCYYYQEESDNMLLEIDLSTGETKEHISAKKYNFGYNTTDSGNSNFFISKNKGHLKYTQFYMNTIFAIEKEDVYPYIMVKSDNWVKKADYLAAEGIEGDDKGDLISAIDSKKRSFEICNYLEWKNNIYLRYNHEFDYYSVLYNKDNNEYSIYKEILSDLLFAKYEYYSPRFTYANSEYAYDILDPYNVELFIEKIKNGEMVLSPNIDKREELMNLNEDQIVIFEYEFK